MKYRMYANKNRVVFVMSSPGCPKMIVTGIGHSAKLKDDYYGSINLKRSVLRNVI